MSLVRKLQLTLYLGLTPFTPTRVPNYADPDHWSYHAVSAVIFGASAYGRWYAPKINVTRIPYTISMIMVPMFYFISIHHKEKRFTYESGPRISFEQNLEFYPITRRAWNRAKATYLAENEKK